MEAAPNPPSLAPPYSEILVELGLVGIHGWDVGGVLFPDNPNLDTPPNEPIVELARKIGETWGKDHGFIVANTQNKDNYIKDGALLKKFKIFERTGIQTDAREHFVQCNGPEEKGKKLDELVAKALDQSDTFRVSALLVDNRFRSVRYASSKIHKFIINGKDSRELGVEDWLSQIQPRLYRMNGELEDVAKEIAARFVQIHLWNIKHLAQERRGHHRWRLFPKLYQDEVKRVRDIFRFCEAALPEELLIL